MHLVEPDFKLYIKITDTLIKTEINVGYLITRQALERKESRGLHFNIDYPPHKINTNNVW